MHWVYAVTASLASIEVEVLSVWFEVSVASVDPSPHAARARTAQASEISAVSNSWLLVVSAHHPEET
jgi:hypothetical protein